MFLWLLKDFRNLIKGNIFNSTNVYNILAKYSPPIYLTISVYLVYIIGYY